MPRYSIITADSDLSVYDLIIDVRSPAEFEEDHIQNSINLPVLDNQQRHEIGLLNKENGFLAAKAGAAIVSQNIAKILKHPALEITHTKKILIYCWRGGHRSNSLAQVLSAVGWKVFLLENGYKAYRNHVIRTLEIFFENPNLNLKIISGYTGSGKTHLLDALQDHKAQVIDLESLANHKGSIFGAVNLGDQPSQRKFESLLFQQLAGLTYEQPIFIEAESNKIGQIYCPASLWHAMKASEVYAIQLPVEERVKCILNDYVFFTENSDEVLELVERLRAIRGAEVVAHWSSLVHNQDWEAFTRSILEDHYDLAYQKAGTERSSFKTPNKDFPIDTFSPEAFSAVAVQLLQC